MAMRGYEHDHESKWLSRMIAPLSRGERTTVLGYHSLTLVLD